MHYDSMILPVLLYTAVLLTGLVLTNDACADEFNIIVHSTSKHFGADKEYNENNTSLAGEYFRDNRALGFAAGVYKDSFKTWAKYGGYLITKKYATGWRVGAMAGFVHSPSYNHGRALPFILPYVSYEWEHFGLNVLALPSPQDSSFTVGFQYKLRM